MQMNLIINKIGDWCKKRNIEGCSMEKITMEQYENLLPMNEKYGKWLNDKITTMRVYKPFAYLFEEIYYYIYKRDDEWHIISEKYEESIDGILELIKKKKAVILTDSTSSDRIKLSYTGCSYQLADRPPMTSNKLEHIILGKKMITNNWQTDVHIIAEFVEEKYPNKDEIQRIYMLNTEGNNPKIGDVFLVRNISIHLQSWKKITRSDQFVNFEVLEKELFKLCFHTPQVEFFAIDIITTPDNFKIIKMYSDPPYPTDCTEGFSYAIDEYLKNSIQDKQKNFSLIEYEKIQQEIKERKKRIRAMYPRGYYPFLETTSSSEFLTNFKSERLLKLDEERWISERGFNHHRIEQYGINRSNQKSLISDFEYEYLGHLNNKYRVWFEDKITIKYILDDFSEYMTEYYYLITMKNGKNKIVTLMDCPNGYVSSYEDIFRLVRQQGTLALKLDEGTHGTGFFKFTFANEKYYLNDNEIRKEDIIELLNDTKSNNQYLVTEFIQQHPSLANIYPGSVNTARLIVFKKDGRTAQIGSGYMRFGHSETGGVDNMGAGGIGVDLDVLTGYYNNAARIRDNITVESCFTHPDTGVLIEGYLPNWNDVIQAVLKIANSLPEIEYIGFDVAFTNDGIKLPELNRFPDFPKLNKLTPETIDYLLYKLEKKKKKYGYSGELSKKYN